MIEIYYLVIKIKMITSLQQALATKMYFNYVFVLQ